MAQLLLDVFWYQRLWLPPNLTWADLEDSPGTVQPRPSDLWLTLPVALLFIGVRLLFERWVATPLARRMGVVETVRREVPPNAVLEKVYRSHTKRPTQAELERLVKQSDWTQRQVERWFRRRRNQDRAGIMKKFCEASWRFVFYIVAFCMGMAVIVDKPWFWEQRECWVGYPKQALLPSQYWYYTIELGFYLSLLFSVAFDVRRKDFKEQIIHHVATIVLISFSYFANYIRAGTLVMAVHDSSDYFLESAKMFNYARWQRTCDSLFVVFTVIFLVTRLVIFPFWIIHCTAVTSLEFYPAFFGYYFFNAMLMVLQLLHIFWAYLIVRMLYRFIFVGQLDKDERSDVDESDGSEEESSTDCAMGSNGAMRNGHAGVCGGDRRATAKAQ